MSSFRAVDVTFSVAYIVCAHYIYNEAGLRGSRPGTADLRIFRFFSTLNLRQIYINLELSYF
jgi:hypothetical protein